MWHRSILDTAEQAKKRGLCLYGAGFLGKIAYDVFHKLGLTATCFCDDDPDKQGQLYQGIPVLSVKDAIEQYPEAVYIPCVDSIKREGHWNRYNLLHMMETLKKNHVYDSNSELRIELYLFLLDIDNRENTDMALDRKKSVCADDIRNLLILNHMSNSGSFYLEQLLDSHPNIVCIPYSTSVFGLVYQNRLQYLEGEELLLEIMAQMLGYFHSAYENLYCVQNTKFKDMCVGQNGEFIFDVLIDPNEFYRQLCAQFDGRKIKLESFAHMMKVIAAAYNNCLGKEKQEGMTYWLFYHMHNASYNVRDTYKEFKKEEFDRVENLIIIREPVQQCYSYILRMVIKLRMSTVLTKNEDFIQTLRTEMGLTLQRQKGIENVRVIRFEDLKYESVNTLKALCRWMEIPYTDSLRHTTLNGQEIYFPVYTADGVKYITGNDTSAVGKKDFSQALTLWDEARLNILYGKFKRAYGYACTTPDFTQFGDTFRRELLTEDFKFCNLVQQVIDEDGLPEDHYDVNRYVKELYQSYMDSYNEDTEYYDYIRPEGGEAE